MKKAISIGLVALTLLAAAIFFRKVRRFLPEMPRAAQLAPVETVFFAQIPNLRSSSQRFQQTNLHAIWMEPEVQAFLQKPRETSTDVRKWEARLALVTRLAPGEVFLAVTASGGPMPKFVAGFSYAGRRSDAEGLVEQLRGEFLPGATKTENQSHLAAAIQTYRCPAGVYSECFVRNWCFVATDAALLRSTLDRFQAPATSVSATLAANDAFLNATAALGSGQDAVVYSRLGASGTVAAQQSGGISAIAAGSKIEGRQFRDRVFLLNPAEREKPPALDRSTLVFSGQETLLYLAFHTNSLTRLSEFLPGAADLAKASLWGDADKVFGPELAITLEWPTDAATPSVLLISELRDSEKARAMVDTLAAGSAETPPWTRRHESNATRYTAAASKMSLFTPTLTLTSRHALLGFNEDAIAAGLKRLQTPDATLETNVAFRRGVSSVAPAQTSFGYLNTSALFDRALRTARPILTMSLAFSDNIGEYLDAGRLPASETVSRHLGPSVFSQSTTENGELFESTGSITFQQLGIGAIFGTIGAKLPPLPSLPILSNPPAPAPPRSTKSTPFPANP